MEDLTTTTEHPTHTQKGPEEEELSYTHTISLPKIQLEECIIHQDLKPDQIEYGHYKTDWTVKTWKIDIFKKSWAI